MYNQQHSQKGDFSSAMLQASYDGRHPAARDMPVTAGDRAHSNLNISSLIDNIQDEVILTGESKQFSRAKQQPKSRQRPAAASQVSQSAAGTSVAGSGQQPQTADPRSPAFDYHSIDLRSISEPSHNGRSWYSYIVFMLMLALTISVALIYHLQSQTSELLGKIKSQDDNIIVIRNRLEEIGSGDVNSGQFVQRIKQLEAELARMDNEYDRLGKKIALQRTDKARADARTLKQMRSNVAYLQRDMKSLQGEIKSLRKNRSAAVANDTSKQALSKPAISKPVASSATEKRAVKKDVTANIHHWSVNLSSFSSREQAEGAASKFDKSDVVPSINQASVNGKTVFRLSVQGFTTQEAAIAFLGQVKKKYGIEGSWIHREQAG